MASSVPSLITAAQSYATTALDGANVALTTGLAEVGRIGWTSLSYDPQALPEPPVLPDALEQPVLQEIVVDTVDEPDDSLIFQDISAIETGPTPTFSATAPTITLPTAPNQLAAFAGVMPAVTTDFDFPEPPSQLMEVLLEEPVLPDRDEPDRPNTNLPAFTAVAPTDVPDAPTDLREVMETTYSGAVQTAIAMMDGQVDAWIEKYNPEYFNQMDALEAKLASYIEGGTGLDEAVETAIYERSRTKQDAEARRTQSDAWDSAAKRGFTIPPGTLLAGLRNARQAAADNNAQAAREIVVLQAELEQKNVQFAITQSQNLRSTVLQASIGFHQNLITINGQALEYAKNVANILVEVYNVATRAFGLQLDAYKTEALVYDTRLKSALAGIELYRLEIEALKAMTDVDQTKVAIYSARVEALAGLASVYRAQIEAVLGRASLEKMKLDVFQTQVQAYTSEVQAKNGEWLAYRAAMEGQQTKVSLYEAQSRAYGQQVIAFKANIEAKAEVVRAQATQNQSLAEMYKARYAGYTALVEGRASIARTQLEGQRQELISFQIGSQAQIATAEMANNYYKSISQVGVENARLSISAIIASAQNQRDQATAVTSLVNANAAVYGQLASAAVAGMNTLASETLAL